MIIVTITPPDGDGDGGGGGGGGPGTGGPGGGEGLNLQLITPTRTWDLSTGPVFALEGASGFGTPDVEHWYRAAPTLNGSIHMGSRVPQRELSLPLEIRDTTKELWLQHDRDFWKSLNPYDISYLRVTMPDATSRYLPVRYNSGGTAELEIDPMLRNQSIYDLELTAADPFWRGEHVEVTYTNVAPANLFPGPPFNINASSTTAEAHVTNPGDEPAWPQWVMNGPFTAATVGVGASLVTITANVLVNEQRIIDMDPNVRSITDQAGVDKWSDATAVAFEAIPPGIDVDLNLSVTGAGAETSIELHFDARYWRAW
jgi:hypothetical protein